MYITDVPSLFHFVHNALLFVILSYSTKYDIFLASTSVFRGQKLKNFPLHVEAFSIVIEKCSYDDNSMKGAETDVLLVFEKYGCRQSYYLLHSLCWV